MRKIVMLALSLTLGMLVSGCCSDDSCNTCNTCYSSSYTGGTVYAGESMRYATASTTTTPSSSTGGMVIMVEDNGVTRPVTLTMAQPTSATTMMSTTSSSGSSSVTPEFTREAATTKIVQRIPRTNLPEGYQYMSEGELSGGKVNAMTIEEGYTRPTTTTR